MVRTSVVLVNCNDNRYWPSSPRIVWPSSIGRAGRTFRSPRCSRSTPPRPPEFLDRGPSARRRNSYTAPRDPCIRSAHADSPRVQMIFTKLHTATLLSSVTVDTCVYSDIDGHFWSIPCGWSASELGSRQMSIVSNAWHHNFVTLDFYRLTVRTWNNGTC